MSELLSARGIVKVYTDGPREVRVLDGVDISVARGEALAVVGRSGAGKSTLLHLLGLIDSPSFGQIALGGEPISGLSGAQRAFIRNRRFGFVFQAYHLIAELSALENILLPAMMEGVLGWRAHRRDARDRARQLLRDVGLEARADHRPAQLSGGERQRVAIARALVNRPEILFCDEPTGNLDEHTSGTISQLLLGLHRQLGLTQVIVTHDRDLARQADRVVRIEGGKIVPAAAGA